MTNRERQVREAALEWKGYLAAARYGHAPEDEIREMDKALVSLTGMLALSLMERGGGGDPWDELLEGTYTALTRWLAKAEGLTSHDSHESNL